MKKIDLNNIETLNRLKEEIDNVFSNEIKKRELNETIANIPNLKYSEIVNIFENISSDLLTHKGGVKLFTNYIKVIKESESLSNIYSLNKFIKEKACSDNNNLLLNEAIKLYGNLNKKEFNDSKIKLGRIVSESVSLLNIEKEEIEKYTNSKDEIFESVNFLLVEDKSIKNINEYTNKFNFVKNFIDENTIKEDGDVCNNINSVKEGLNNILEECNSAWEKELVKDISLLTLSNGSKEEMFNSYKERCISTINEMIEHDINNELKSKITLMKENLNNKHFCLEKFNEDIINLAELNETLQETWVKE